MLSVGIDVSKGESMVCALNQFGKVVLKPCKYRHSRSVLGNLAERLRALGDNEIKIILEATGIYSLPIAKYFREQGFFVSVINPYVMSQFRKGGQGDLRNVKTDKADSITIATYGNQLWYKLVEYNPSTDAKALERVGTTLRDILSQMEELAKSLPEYDIVRPMGGVGDVLAVKLIAAIGDLKRFKKAKSLVAYAGIDPPPYSSGKFEGNKRRISKRGSTLLRKIGYEIMKCLTRNSRPEDGAIYDFIRKKESEGKSKKQAKIAGLNKFLQIYYARVMEAYKRIQEEKAA